MNIETIEIVPATPAHVPEIVELWIELTDFHKEISPYFARSEDAATHFEDHINEWISKGDTQVLVALYNNIVVAYSIAEVLNRPPLFKERTFGFISDLAVKSEYRRKGIGGKMLEKMFEWFKSHNLQRIHLQVVPQNEVACSFWKKHGFCEHMHTLYIIRE